MPYYRKKPIVIECMQYVGDNLQHVLDWANDLSLQTVASHSRNGQVVAIEIPTLEGTMTASPGDWIAKGVRGELYPIRDDIFKATYEALD